MSEVSYPKNKINILLLENISDEAVREFQEAGYTSVRKLHRALNETELIEELHDVHVLGIRSKTQITETVLKNAPRLMAVGCFCIGTNQVDKAAANQMGIAVFNAPYSNTRSVAELVIGAAIMLIRKIPDKNKAAHEGIWQKESVDSHEIRGKILGIVGYGNIGSQVSVLAESMGMQVVFYDLEKKLPLGNARCIPDLKSMLQLADVVTLHVPCTPDTTNFMNAEMLACCKPGAVFINFARGEVVDADALADAIKSGPLSGAAVDVFPKEPEKNGMHFTSPLQGLSNVLLTPHIGGSTEEAQADIGQDVSGKLISFIENGTTQGSLTIPELSLARQEGTHRILHIHQNRPGVLAAVNAQFSNAGINILGQYLKTNDRIGYVVLDVDKQLSDVALNLIKNLPETIRVRLVY